MGRRWEVDEADWERVRGKIRGLLEEAAGNGSWLVYSDIVTGISELAGPDSHAFHEMLGEISADCHASGLPLLSALAVYKGTYMPGLGFYRAAKSLGLDVGASHSARYDFWWRQVELCHEAWRRR
ncbi:hypothetical protein ACFYPH_30405 [Micromonospora sp. NPDC005252]|uniref:hypothetical protein n=1 Tax=Micromonospora sp. NPDC005252 TaxID=3364228 RepID=UPI003676E064